MKYFPRPYVCKPCEKQRRGTQGRLSIEAETIEDAKLLGDLVKLLAATPRTQSRLRHVVRLAMGELDSAHARYLATALQAVLPYAYVIHRDKVQCRACATIYGDDQPERPDENWHGLDCPVFAAELLLGRAADIRRGPVPDNSAEARRIAEALADMPGSPLAELKHLVNPLISLMEQRDVDTLTIRRVGTECRVSLRREHEQLP